MNPVQAVATCFRKYVDFHGYAPRSEYWWWYAFTSLLKVATTVIDVELGGPYFTVLVSLALMLPSLTVLVRRVRDTGHHWAWIFIGLVPLLGGIVLLVITLERSKPRFVPMRLTYPYAPAT